MQQLAAIRPLFPRNSYLIVNGIRINDENNGGLKFKVDLKSGKDKKIGTARFFIYNLSQDIEVGSEISLYFGYDSDVGEYSTYEVVKVNKYREEGNIVRELLCSERSKNTSKIISLSLDGNVRISEAIKQVAQAAGITIISLELANDKVYTNGYTCYNKAFDELRELIEDAESKMIIKSSDLYVYHKDFKEKIINLSFKTGLLKNPTFSEKILQEKEVDKSNDNGTGNLEWEAKNQRVMATTTKEYDFDVECLPIHYLKKGDVLNIDSETFTGLAQIREIDIKLEDMWSMRLKVKVV